jgi:hydroxymethylpyrimidine/phosphomethylpyrimidine kinase
MTTFSKPFVLSIAGHDPCAGAGLTADIKTFEAHGVYGLSVVTALTVQNDSEFKQVQWVDIDLIKAQTEILFEKYDIPVAKIGLIQNDQVLQQVVKHLKKLNANIKIVWDPILKSSSGFDFKNVETNNFDFLRDLFLITPNQMEFDYLKEKGIDLQVCNCLLKGGHRNTHKGTDVLVSKGQSYEIKGDSFKGKTKHGTGCTLSASIVANMALGDEVLKACEKGKKYVEQFILSADGNLGIHPLLTN